MPASRKQKEARWQLGVAVAGGNPQELEDAIRQAEAAGIGEEGLEEARRLLHRKVQMTRARQKAAQMERNLAHRELARRNFKKALAGSNFPELKAALEEAVAYEVIPKPKAAEILRKREASWRETQHALKRAQQAAEEARLRSKLQADLASKKQADHQSARPLEEHSDREAPDGEISQTPRGLKRRQEEPLVLLASTQPDGQQKTKLLQPTQLAAHKPKEQVKRAARKRSVLGERGRSAPAPVQRQQQEHRIDIERRAKARDDAQHRARAVAKAREEAERRAKQEAERRAQEEAERRAREEAARIAREQSERIAREDAERRAREEAERRAREEAECRAREEAERRAREEEERRAREEKRRAREEVERRAREDKERRAREEVERAAREQAERRATEQAERRAQEEAERRATEQAERRAQEEAKRRAKEEAERKAQEEAERRAQEEAQSRAREEAERRAQEEAQSSAREEAQRKAHQEVQRRAQEEAERRAREEAERRAKEEAERRAREEAERKAQEEAQRRAQEEAERRAREEAERRAREEAERRAREEAERRAQEEAERKAFREAECRAQDQADCRAQQQIDNAQQGDWDFDAEWERWAQEEMDKLDQEEAKRKAQEEEERRAREEAERRAKREVERRASARAKAKPPPKPNLSKRKRVMWAVLTAVEAAVCLDKLAEKSKLAADLARVVIVDFGTSLTRIGWSDAQGPAHVKHQPRFDIEQLMQDAKRELHVDFTRHPVLVTGSLHANETSRAGIAMSLLDKLRCPFMCVVNTAVLALTASGRRSGIVVDLGASMTRIVPVYERRVVKACTRHICDFSGDEVDGYLFSLVGGLSQDKHPKDKARTVKEQVCRVAFHYTREHDLLQADPPSELMYAIDIENDGHSRGPIVVAPELIQAPEAYFKPRLNGKLKAKGLPDMIAEVVAALEPSLRRLLCRNILLVGRGACLPGLRDRLAMELAERLPPAYDVRVHGAPGLADNSSAYRGAMELARSENFRSMCLSRDEYLECGVQWNSWVH